MGTSDDGREAEARPDDLSLGRNDEPSRLATMAHVLWPDYLTGLDHAPMTDSALGT